MKEGRREGRMREFAVKRTGSRSRRLGLTILGCWAVQAWPAPTTPCDTTGDLSFAFRSGRRHGPWLCPLSAAGVAAAAAAAAARAWGGCRRGGRRRRRLIFWPKFWAVKAVRQPPEPCEQALGNGLGAGSVSGAATPSGWGFNGTQNWGFNGTQNRRWRSNSVPTPSGWGFNGTRNFAAVACRLQ